MEGVGVPCGAQAASARIANRERSTYMERFIRLTSFGFESSE